MTCRFAGSSTRRGAASFSTSWKTMLCASRVSIRRTITTKSSSERSTQPVPCSFLRRSTFPVAIQKTAGLCTRPSDTEGDQCSECGRLPPSRPHFGFSPVSGSVPVPGKRIGRSREERSQPDFATSTAGGEQVRDLQLSRVRVQQSPACPASRPRSTPRQTRAEGAGTRSPCRAVGTWSPFGPLSDGARSRVPR